MTFKYVAVTDGVTTCVVCCFHVPLPALFLQCRVFIFIHRVYPQISLPNRHLIIEKYFIMEEEKFTFTDGCFFREEAIRTPEAVIKEFYSIYELEDVKIMIWKLFRGAMSTEAQIFKLPEENDYVIWFLENLLMLNIAVHEISKRE
jgi:hypothetical protein